MRNQYLRFHSFNKENKNLYSQVDSTNQIKYYFYRFSKNNVIHCGPFRQTFEESRRDLFIKKCVLS